MFAKLDASDAIVFGSPTYMGGPAAQFKAFADATSGRWFGGAWRDKIAAGFTVSMGPSGDKLSTLHYFFTLAMQHGMVWVGLGLLDGNGRSTGSDAELNRLGGYAGAMAQSNSDQGLEGMYDSDLRTASALGERVARHVTTWQGGGQ